MEDTFLGFDEPQQNWSKLPHDFINYLPLIKSLSELKIILYVLRHTWGYHDDYKKISHDEFINGRKQKDGKRIDKGTGMSINAVKQGIQYAVEHGFLEVVIDNSDKARVKHFYCLRKKDNSTFVQDQKLTVGDQKLILWGSEVDPRTKKDTIERNLKRNNNYVSDADASPDNFLDQLQLIDVKTKKKPRKANPVHCAVVKLQELEPTIKKGFAYKTIKELFELGYTEQQIIDCGKNLQQRDWWIKNNILLSPAQIKKHIANFAQQQSIDEHGNYVETLSDGTQVITLSSEIQQDSNIIVVE